MGETINAKHLRAHLADIVAEVRRGSRFTVLYRSRPAFDIVPVGDPAVALVDLASDPLYKAAPVGSSGDGKAARRHDDVLYT